MKAYAVTSANVTGAFPVSAGKNASTGSSVDGTPYHQDYISDVWALLQALMDRVSMTPSGTVEAYTAVGSGSSAGLGQTVNDGAQQHLASFARNFAAPGELVFDVVTTSPTRRVLPLQGQVVDGYLYPDLWYATWVGAGANGTAAYFYTTSDAGGTTRATTGLTVNGVTGGRYLVLPDFRGLSPIGLGVNAKTAIAYTGGATLAAYLADKMQGHKHGISAGQGSHGHSITDPGHVHTIPAAAGGTPGPNGQSNGVNSAAPFNSNSSTTGIGIVANTLPAMTADSIVTDGSNGTPRVGLYTATPGFACNIGIRY